MDLVKKFLLHAGEQKAAVTVTINLPTITLLTMLGSTHHSRDFFEKMLVFDMWT